MSLWKRIFLFLILEPRLLKLRPTLPAIPQLTPCKNWQTSLANFSLSSKILMLVSRKLAQITLLRRPRPRSMINFLVSTVNIRTVTIILAAWTRWTPTSMKIWIKLSISLRDSVNLKPVKRHWSHQSLHRINLISRKRSQSLKNRLSKLRMRRLGLNLELLNSPESSPRKSKWCNKRS